MEDRLEDFRSQQQQDKITRQLITCCSEGWLETKSKSGLSPAELLMGRKIHTRIPTSPDNLRPSWSYLETLPDLLPGERVWLPDKKVEGTVVDKAGPPCSYTVETPKGQLRRNRRHLNDLPEAPNTDTCTTLSSSSSDVQTVKSLSQLP